MVKWAMEHGTTEQVEKWKIIVRENEYILDIVNDFIKKNKEK